jgi:hypothetical protein
VSALARIDRAIAFARQGWERADQAARHSIRRDAKQRQAQHDSAARAKERFDDLVAVRAVLLDLAIAVAEAVDTTPAAQRLAWKCHAGLSDDPAADLARCARCSRELRALASLEAIAGPEQRAPLAPDGIPLEHDEPHTRPRR